MSILGRGRGQRAEMGISEAQLSAMTSELHDLHESTFPSVRRALDEISDQMGAVLRGPSSRRGFFLGTAGVITLGAVAACSNSERPYTGPPVGPVPLSPQAGGGIYTGDLKIVALAAALENLAVTAYGGALRKAGAGELGTVPPAVATFIQTAMKQHADHAQAWNAVLSKSGKPTVTDAPLTITADQVNKLNAAKSVPDVAKLALNLENSAAQTYTFATANVTDPGGIMTAATIQPVETMHAAILSFILGEYPVPDSFIGTDHAVKPDTLTR